MALTDNLIHVWEFEADTGLIFDLIGSDDFSIVGTQVPAVNGIIGKAANFQTTQNYATLQGSTAGLDGVDALSVTSWIWLPATTGSSRRAWISQSGTGALIRASIGPTNIPFIQMFNDSETISVVGTGAFAEGTWNLLGYTFERNVGARLFRNGVFDVSATQTVDEATATNVNLAFNVHARDGVGGGVGSGSEPLKGQQDQLAIWDRAISDAEHGEVWNGGSGRLLVGGGTGAGRSPAMASGWLRKG